MKIKKNKLKIILTLLKNVEDKHNNVTLQVENGKLCISAKNELAKIKTKILTSEEAESEMYSIEKSFLTKLEKQDADEFELKINKKKITTKSGGVNFATNILEENQHIEIKEIKFEKEETVEINENVIENLKAAMSFTSKSSKRVVLQGVNLKSEDGKLTISGTDGFKIFTSTTETKAKDFNITLRTETINMLITIFEVSNKKPYPLNITESAVYISSKGLYYISSVMSELFPDVNKVLQGIKKEPAIDKLEITEDMIKKLKAIESKSQTLEIESKEEKIKFSIKTETTENAFSVENKGSDKEYKKSLNYESFYMAVQRIQTVRILEKMFVLAKGSEIIVIMVMMN